MVTFADIFRQTFGDRGLDAWSVLDDSRVDTYLYVRQLPVSALRDLSVALRDTVAVTFGPLPVAYRDALVDSVLAVSNLVLSSRSEAQANTRLILDALVSSSVGPNSLELALAAVVHARAGDSLLAQARLRQLQADDLEVGGQTERLVRFAQLLLGIELSAVTASRPGKQGEVDLVDLLWDRYLALPLGLGLEPFESVVEAVGMSAGRSADKAFDNVVGVLAGVALVTGSTEQLSQEAPELLAQAEQLLWASGRARMPMWASMALASARTGDLVLAERATDEAFNSASSSLHDSDYDWAKAAGDLLEAKLLGNASPRSHQSKSAPHTVPSNVREHGAIPPDLASQLASGSVLLVAGPELPTARGGPSREDLLLGVVNRPAGGLSRIATDQLVEGLQRGNVDKVAPLLRATGENLERLVDGELGKKGSGPSSSYAALARIPFGGVVDLSWDNLLLTAFADRNPSVIHAGSDAVLDTARSQEFAFTWLAGDPRNESIAIGSRELRRRLAANETLRRYLSGAVQSLPVLFLGVRAGDVIDFFECIEVQPPTNAITTQYYAICAADEYWDFERERLQAEYRVESVGYNPRTSELSAIIEQLAEESRPTAGFRDPSRHADDTRLSRVILTNIGAFEDLDLTLASGWNVVLGNNGCGKSTVLRAVALGLCGDHPSAAAAGARLLRTGTGRGAIELVVGKSRYRTELVRSGDAVHVRTTSLTPLQQGQWAVLGFPALRGVSIATPTGTGPTQASEPRVEDLLPLLLDEVDHRLDDIKQWIVNVDARSREQSDPRSQRLLERFFDVLRELTPGETLEFDSVDVATWQVRVRTDDGVVSIDQLSQGMDSIIAWVGTLLQRMYDIHRDSDDPAAEGAFVLIDELDAHLHPAWQRLVPKLTRAHFPNVQFLSTSHSPLIVGNLEPGELFVSSREPRVFPDGTDRLVATIEVAEVDPQGLRADQILTSPLFGLMTSRSPKLDEMAARYDELFIKESRTEEEEKQLHTLRERLATSYLDGETAAQRALEAAEAAELDKPLPGSAERLSKVQQGDLQRLASALDALDDEQPSGAGS